MSFRKEFTSAAHGLNYMSYAHRQLCQRAGRWKSLVQTAHLGPERLGAMDQLRRRGASDRPPNPVSQLLLCRMDGATKHRQKANAGDGNFLPPKRRLCHSADTIRNLGGPRRLLLHHEPWIASAICLWAFGNRTNRELRLFRAVPDMGIESGQGVEWISGSSPFVTLRE